MKNHGRALVVQRVWSWFMPRNTPAERAARKEKQDREGAVNMARYQQEQQATLAKTVRLRAQRLAQPAMKNPTASVKKKRTA
jgi:hypothetical protein